MLSTKIKKPSSYAFNILFCAIGCIACFYLQKSLSIPSFLASAFTGFIASFLPASQLYDNSKSIACMYTGSFAAMCSLSYFTHSIDIFLLSFFVGLYFNIFSPYFRGIGGKLGTIGFISALTFVLLKAIV